MLNLQAFPFVLYKNLVEAIFLFLFLFCPPFVPFLSPVFCTFACGTKNGTL